MDDLILKAAIWQDECWVDRSALLKGNISEESQTHSGKRVLLLTLDHNCKYFKYMMAWLLLTRVKCA